jgi:acyl-CoA oxidase
LLGEVEKSASPHEDFLRSIWRVAVGTLALSALAIPALQISSTIAYRYSCRRKITGSDGNSIPIISIRTQQAVVFAAIAQAYVLKAFYKHAVALFLSASTSAKVKHGIATVFKAVALRQAIDSQSALSERCGAQGLFDYNQIISQTVNLPPPASHALLLTMTQSEIRAIAIAEGDVLVLSIRTWILGHHVRLLFIDGIHRTRDRAILGSLFYACDFRAWQPPRAA